ncbi:hypothetical protein DBR39_12400 [Chryseobacterium sp. KBW03]|uniref:hypothetical protein n=1 Tax=Bacteroidota TaxID=976 RepID=UPI000F59DA0C|nr:MULTISPECIES: hypothetical protein [Bacteroidota]RQO37685.1 hypothetical protein DBR39_12400 [Chryseobacterium sp. KBW03]
MVGSKDNPDYIFEEYKGYIIASHKRNVAERHVDNFILIYKEFDFPHYGYVLGLDDSKSSGGRVMYPSNLEDAKFHIDRELKEIRKKALAVIPKKLKGPKL